MKQTAALFVVAGALMMAIVASARPRSNTPVTAVSIHQTSGNAILADGGLPTPPIPPGGPSRVA